MNRNIYKSVIVLLFITVFSWGNAAEKLPLDAFAMQPTIQKISVSGNGKKLAMLRATSKNGDYIVEIFSTKDLMDKPVRLGADRMEITGFNWLNNDMLLLNFRQNIQDGSRNYWVTKAAIVKANGQGDWRVPFPKENSANFSVLSLLRNDPNHILLTYDINDNRIPDVVRYNINTGATKTIVRGNSKIDGGFIPDAEGKIRAATGFDLATSSIKSYARLDGEAGWREIYTNSPENRETWEFLSFSKENPDEIYIKANLGENATGVYAYNIRTAEYSERLFGLKSVDVDGVILGDKLSNLGILLGFSYTSKHPKRYFLDGNEEVLYTSIEALFPQKLVSLVSRSEDDNTIIIRTSSDKDPGSYFLLKDKKQLKFLGERSPLIKPEHLASVKYVKYTARDGRKIPAYITIPQGEAPFPAVVMPHGGPWVRDINIYDNWAQMLAHYGYIVIQPQYRGSTGFGLEHWKAGDKKWGLEMQDDNDDAAMYLVEKGLATEGKLAIWGWSYGGYAALVGSMREENIYQCAIAGASVSDIEWWGANINSSRFLRIFQAPTVKGISPVTQADKVNVPILVIHGDIDHTVPVGHSRKFVKELIRYKKEHKYIEINGLDHSPRDYYHNMKIFGALLGWLEEKC